MADFIESYNTSATFTEGSLNSVISGEACDFAILMTRADSLAPNRAVFLMASNAENFSIKSYNTGADNQGHTGSSTTYYYAITNAASNPDVLSETNGGGLMQLANQYKELYFDGVTQTPASLKAYLDNKYGEHKYYYCGLGLFSSYVWLPDVNPMYIQSITVSMDYSSPMYDDPTQDPTTWVNPSYDLAGGPVTYPADIPPASSEQDDRPAFRAWWVFQEQSESTELQFDVYIDGTQDPNIYVKWKANRQGSDFSLQTCTPIVWAVPTITIGQDQVIDDGGIRVPNEANSYMKKYANTWPGSYASPYLTQVEACAADASTAARVLQWGVSGIPGMMNYYLRFNYQYMNTMTWGDMFLVGIPREVQSAADVQVVKLSTTAYGGPFNTKVVIHLGEPDDQTPDDDTDYPEGENYDGTGPGPYNPEEPKPDFTQYERTGFSGKAVLTKTYAMDNMKLANVGSKLWSQSYFDVLKVQNNPIENIVGVKWFPFSQNGVVQDIVVGNINLGLQAGVVDSLYTINIGSTTYTAKNPSAPTFMDYSPYTILKLHCPYVGILQLDASECMNRKISVKYVIDLVTGDCIAYIYLDDGKMPYLTASGNCGVDIPITASNRVQSEMRAASTAISAVTGAAAHVIAGDVAGGAVDAAQGALTLAGMDYTTQRTSNHSPACATRENGAIFLEIWRPAFDLSVGFKQRHGWPCHKFMTLGSLPGFVKCDSRTKIDFAMTGRENEMLEGLLTDGVYITPRDPSWAPIPD